MSLYARLYKDGTALSPDIDLPSAGSITGVTNPEIRNRIDFVGQTVEMHQRGYYLDRGLKYPGTVLDGDVINEPWTDLAAWDLTEDGTGVSEIDPAGELRQYASGTGDTLLDDGALSDTFTKYTWEFEQIINTKQEHGITTNYLSLTGTGDLYIEFTWDGVGWYIDVRIAANSQKFYTSVTGWHTYRLLLSSTPIPTVPGMGGGWFLF